MSPHLEPVELVVTRDPRAERLERERGHTDRLYPRQNGGGRKLELGVGYRPTVGYEHNDMHPFPHIEHLGEAWMLDLPDETFTEVLALAFIEHLTHDHALDTFRNVRRMLRPGGYFLFDVPDYPKWCEYYLRQIRSQHEYTDLPSIAHCRRTLFGWQRWPGDEHLYGWEACEVTAALKHVGFESIIAGVQPFLDRGLHRERFHNPKDAHIYLTCRA